MLEEGVMRGEEGMAVWLLCHKPVGEAGVDGQLQQRVFRDVQQAPLVGQLSLRRAGMRALARQQIPQEPSHHHPVPSGSSSPAGCRTGRTPRASRGRPAP